MNLTTRMVTFFKHFEVQPAFIDEPFLTWKKVFRAREHPRRENVVFDTDMGKDAEAALKFSIKEADIELIASHLSKP